MEKNDRRPGYYRVKYKGSWRIAEYIIPTFAPERIFWLIASTVLSDEDLEEIDDELICAEPSHIKLDAMAKAWKELEESGELDRLAKQYIEDHPEEFNSTPADPLKPQVPSNVEIDEMAILKYPHHPGDHTSHTHHKYETYIKGMIDMRDYLYRMGLLNID